MNTDPLPGSLSTVTSPPIIRADIPHKSRIELGGTSETILRCAKEEEAELIVLAEESPGLVRRWLLRTAGISLGSVASVVIGLSNAAVVIVK